MLTYEDLLPGHAVHMLCPPGVTHPSDLTAHSLEDGARELFIEERPFAFGGVLFFGDENLTPVFRIGAVLCFCGFMSGWNVDLFPRHESPVVSHLDRFTPASRAPFFHCLLSFLAEVDEKYVEEPVADARILELTRFVLPLVIHEENPLRHVSW